MFLLIKFNYYHCRYRRKLSLETFKTKALGSVRPVFDCGELTNETGSSSVQLSNRFLTQKSLEILQNRSAVWVAEFIL